jgi:hypothetical protein
MAQKSVFAVSLENRSQKQMDMSLAFIKAGNFSFGSSPGGLDLRRWLKDELLTTYAVPFFDTCCSTTPYNLEKYISTNLDNIISIGTDGLLYATAPQQGVTSVDLSMPSAFTVSGTPITTSGTISVVGSGTSAQYIDGTGSLKTFPTLIPTASGGTGITTYNLGDTLYGNSSNTLSKLTGNTTIIPKVLMQTGTGSASAAPLWFDLFNTTNNWVAQKVSVEGTNLNTSLSAGIPATYIGYGAQGSMNGGSGTIILYDRTNVTGGYANIVSRETTIKPMSSGFGTGAYTQISTATPGPGGASQEIQYTNCGGIIFSSTVTPNLYGYSPFLTVGIKELGYGTYLGYNATVPAFQMRVANNFTSGQHKSNVEIVVPETGTITTSIVATRYDLCTNDSTTFIQEYLKKSFTLNLQGWNVTPTANIHIGASVGGDIAGTAPLKFSAVSTLTNGSTVSSITSALLGTPEQGAMEVDGNGQLYYSTNTTTKSRGFVEVARYTAVSATYTATPDDYTINCTSGTFNVTLPTAVGIQGRIYKVKNSGSGTITLNTTGGQTIDGASNKVLSTQYQVITVQSTGSNWIVL